MGFLDLFKATENKQLIKRNEELYNENKQLKETIKNLTAKTKSLEQKINLSNDHSILFQDWIEDFSVQYHSSRLPEYCQNEQLHPLYRPYPGASAAALQI